MIITFVGFIFSTMLFIISDVSIPVFPITFGINDDTLLYGPEIKFFSNEIETDDKFRLKDANVYFVGDGAGKAGNIVTAAATGLVAARDILERIK